MTATIAAAATSAPAAMPPIAAELSEFVAALCAAAESPESSDEFDNDEEDRDAFCRGLAVGRCDATPPLAELPLGDTGEEGGITVRVGVGCDDAAAAAREGDGVAVAAAAAALEAVREGDAPTDADKGADADREGVVAPVADEDVECVPVWEALGDGEDAPLVEPDRVGVAAPVPEADVVGDGEDVPLGEPDVELDDDMVTEADALAEAVVEGGSGDAVTEGLTEGEKT